MKDIIVNDRYRLDRKIGEGGWSVVYSGTDLRLNQEIAMKIDTGGRMLTLDHENMWYETVSHAVGIPKVHWFGEHDFATVMVLDALGPSLDILLGYCDDRFSLKTVLLIAKQALHRIQHIHSKGVLHCDLKPDNFLMGTGKQGNVLYVIDFGVTTTHDVVEGEEQGQGRPFRGTAEFASINALRELKMSWGDDLESLGYVLVYLAHGTLPWTEGEVDREDTEEYFRTTGDMKARLSPEEICDGLPAEFAQYIEYTRSLPLGVRPNYRYLHRLIDRMFKANGFKHDNIFDWTEKLFHEIRSRHGGQTT